MSLDAANISHYLALLNGLISASAHTEEYRQMVAKAIAEGRDISNDELAAVAQRVQASLDEAQKAVQDPNAPAGEVTQ